MVSRHVVGLGKHKYAVLLAVLIVSLTIQSFDAQAGAVGTLSDAFRTVLGVLILVVVFERPRERVGMAVILALTVAIGWGRHSSAGGLDHSLSLALHTLMSAFLWATVWVILRDLFRRSAIGAESVLAAICALGQLGGSNGPVFVIQHRADVDNRLRGCDAGAGARDDVESVRCVVRIVLYRRRRVAVRGHGTGHEA